jgi:outer membrane protein OmpA-like peptidoglycan-associated protein
MSDRRVGSWLGVVLALCSILPVVASSASAPNRAQQRELDRAESLLREWAMQIPPEIPVEITRDSEHVTMLFSSSLVFELDGSTLLPDAAKQAPLEEAIRVLKRRRALTAQIVVHTDNIGGLTANQSFSAARAKALFAAFTAAGIAPARVHQRGAGLSDPLSSNGTAEGRSENRRIEIQFQRTG